MKWLITTTQSAGDYTARVAFKASALQHNTANAGTHRAGTVAGVEVTVS
jgi:hypothetical protein